MKSELFDLVALSIAVVCLMMFSQDGYMVMRNPSLSLGNTKLVSFAALYFSLTLLLFKRFYELSEEFHAESSDAGVSDGH